MQGSVENDASGNHGREPMTALLSTAETARLDVETVSKFEKLCAIREEVQKLYTAYRTNPVNIHQNWMVDFDSRMTVVESMMTVAQSLTLQLLNDHPIHPVSLSRSSGLFLLSYT